MNITSIKLKNYKCFKEADIKFSRITLLTGANSSGKSSLINSILAALQTEGFPFYLSPNGKYVNMGSFEEISFNHNRKATIEITLELLARGFLLPDNSRISIMSKWCENPKSKIPQLEELHYKSSKTEIIIEKKDNKHLFSLTLEKPMYSIGRIQERLKRQRNSIKAESVSIDKNQIKFVRIPAQNVDEIFEKYINFKSDSPFVWELREVRSIFRNFDMNFNFIGSFREAPERTYYQKAKAFTKIDNTGAGYIDQISEWENNEDTRYKELNKTLKAIGLLAKVKIKNLSGGRFELNVKPNEKGVLASITDVGFGISQFLPIVVADLQLADSSILAMSQPEIHLHPKVQASLADYLVRQVKKKKKQYLIETHSEYLINRIRLQIVKGVLSPKDVSIYYLSNEPKGTKIYEIKFTKSGQILHAPEDFFKTYMMDVMDIAMYATT